MKYGPTGYELTYIKPHVVRISHQKEMSWREFFAWMLFIATLVGLTLFIHSFEPATPVAHAEVQTTHTPYMLADTQTQTTEMTGMCVQAKADSKLLGEKLSKPVKSLCHDYL